MYHGSYLTAGCWSPTRPGVFFTAKQDGTMDVWDYFYQQNKPTIKDTKVSDKPIQCLRVDSGGQVRTASL